MNKPRLTYYLTGTMQMLTVIWLFMLTLMSVEVRWAEADALLLTSLPIVGAASIAVFLFCKSKGQITPVDAVIVLWSLYYIGRVYIGAEYPCATESLKMLTSILLYAVLRLAFHSTRIPAMYLILILIACGTYETLTGIYQLITGTSRHYLFLLTGNFLNPGPYSAYLMIASVAGLSLMQTCETPLSSHLTRLTRFTRLKWRYVILIPTIIMLMLLPSTWSRAAFSGTALCVLWIYRKHWWRYRWVVFIAIIFLWVGFYFLKRGSADSRGLIWIVSLTSWLHHPWFGVGIGGFRHACAEGIAEMYQSAPDSHLFDPAGVTDYAYNELIKVMTEQGIIGALLFIAAISLGMVRLYRSSKPLFMAMLSLLIFSMFSYPSELLPYRIITITTLAWSESTSKNKYGLSVCRKICIFACLLVVTSGCLLKSEVTERMEQDRDASHFSRMQNAAFLPDYYELLPYELDNPQYLFDFALTLRAEKRLRDSNAILRKGTLVSSDPMFHVMMGNNYKKMGQYIAAEREYLKAYSMMPNRIYPLYKLMKLYELKGDRDKCQVMARRVYDFMPKIKSSATDDMKKEASRIMANKNK